MHYTHCAHTHAHVSITIDELDAIYGTNRYGMHVVEEQYTSQLSSTHFPSHPH